MDMNSLLSTLSNILVVLGVLTIIAAILGFVIGLASTVFRHLNDPDLRNILLRSALSAGCYLEAAIGLALVLLISALILNFINAMFFPPPPPAA